MLGSRMPSFIKLPAYNKFDYKPRYYDPQVERRENNKPENNISFQHGAHQKYGSYIAGQLKQQHHYQRKAKLAARNSSYRVLMMIGMLSLPVAYYMGYIPGYTALAGVFLFFVIFVKKLSDL